MDKNNFDIYLNIEQHLFERQYINNTVSLNESFLNQKRYSQIFEFIHKCLEHIYSYKPEDIKILNDKISGNLLISFKIKNISFQLIVDFKNLKIELNQHLINTISSLKKNIYLQTRKVKTTMV